MFKKLLISLDGDDVLLPCTTPACLEANRRFNLHIDPSTVRRWGFLDLTEEERNAVYSVFEDPTFYESQVPFPGAVEMVEALVKWGHDVLFLSATKSVAMSVRANTFRKFFPMVPERNILLGERKDIVRTDIHLDDGMHNIITSISRYPVIMEQPWNIHDPKSAGYLRVSNYEAFLSLVRQLSQSDTPMPSLHTREPHIICLVGPTGAGKKELCSELVKNPAYVSLKSCTTRERHPGESENAYCFLNKTEFEQRKDEFIETSLYAGDYYGLPTSEVMDTLNKGYNAVFITDIKGALTFRQKFGKKAVLVFVHRDKYAVIEDLIARDMPVEARATRIMSLEEEYSNEAMCDYTVLANIPKAEMAERVISFVES